jgi:hypothetical protein
MRLKDTLIVSVLLLGAFACLWHGLSPDEAVTRSELATTPVTHSPPLVVEQAIETVQVGQRVWIGDNPSQERDLQIGEDIADPRLWREMRLRCPKRDGTLADVRMLRPVSWLEERGVHPGGRVDVEVPECGISGLADVLEVLPCPAITPSQGRVVTATFHHQAAQTIDVAVEGLDGPIGSTPNHPFWSETQGEFVRADRLRPGDEVRTLHGTARVTSVTPRGPPEPVYNLEVQCEHVYRVAGVGVLVHNGGLNILNPCFEPKYGSYTNRHASGKSYHGEGTKTRSNVSGMEKAKAHNDPHIATDWKPAPNRREAFKDEAKRLEADRGPGNLDNYNKINSPGKRYLQQDGQ